MRPVGRVGDDSEGVAAVFDPRADVDCYLELACAKQVSITHIFETHIHADLFSGARELGARVESARIFVSHEGGVGHDFDPEPSHDGDIFEFGSALITARRTPGHTPEHVAYLVAEKDHLFLGELRERLGKLDRTKATAVCCDSGYRASIATSVPQQAGFGCVCNILGCWQAWKEAGFPV